MVWQIGMSNDGRILICVCDDGTLWRWNTVSVWGLHFLFDDCIIHNLCCRWCMCGMWCGGVMRYNVVWCDVMWCGVMRCCVMLCGVVRCGVVGCGGVFSFHRPLSGMPDSDIEWRHIHCETLAYLPRIIINCIDVFMHSCIDVFKFTGKPKKQKTIFQIP